MANSLPHDNIRPYEQSEKGKKEQVADMFNNIAGKYDFMNRFLSVGTDTGWRKKAIKWLQPAAPQHLLDIATGTGDMALMAYKMLKPRQITGIDISTQMLEVGRKKIEKEGLVDKITLHTGDSEAIKFDDNTFDAGMVAFGIRNFENLEQGLQEILRVLQPGAPLVILEFSKPKQPFKTLYNLYMKLVAPNVARMITKDQQAYEYLTASANAFPERKQLTDILNKAGYTDTRYKSLSLGICCIYTGKKPLS